MPLFKMQNWLISIIGAVIISTIATFVMPIGRTNKAVKSVFSILLILIIFKPVFNINISDITKIFTENNVNLQLDYVEYFNKEKNKSNEKLCNSLLYEYNFTNATTSIEYKTLTEGVYKIEKVKIFLNLKVIKENNEHINIIDELRDKIKEILCIEKEQVIVYD